MEQVILKRHGSKSAENSDTEQDSTHRHHHDKHKELTRASSSSSNISHHSGHNTHSAHESGHHSPSQLIEARRTKSNSVISNTSHGSTHSSTHDSTHSHGSSTHSHDASTHPFDHHPQHPITTTHSHNTIKKEKIYKKRGSRWILYLDLDNTIVLKDELRPGLAEFLTILTSPRYNFEIRVMTNRLRCWMDIPKYNAMLREQGCNVTLPFPTVHTREEMTALSGTLFRAAHEYHPEYRYQGVPIEVSLDIYDQVRLLDPACIHILHPRDDWVRKDLAKFLAPRFTGKLVDHSPSPTTSGQQQSGPPPRIHSRHLGDKKASYHESLTSFLTGHVLTHYSSGGESGHPLEISLSTRDRDIERNRERKKKVLREEGSSSSSDGEKEKGKEKERDTVKESDKVTERDTETDRERERDRDNKQYISHNSNKREDDKEESLLDILDSSDDREESLITNEQRDESDGEKELR